MTERLEAVVEAAVLDAAMGPLAALTDECRISVRPDGWFAKAVDQAHVAMVTVELRREAFSSYRASDVELTVDLARLGEVVKLARGVGPISLRYEPEDGFLVAAFGNITKRMRTLDPSGVGEPKIPDIERHLSARVRLDAADLRNAILAAGDVADNIAFEADGEGFAASARGDTDDIEMPIGRADLKDFGAPDAAPGAASHAGVRSEFPLDYLSNMVKTCAEASALLRFGHDYPLKLEWDLTGGGKVLGHVAFMLAPRIGESDEPPATAPASGERVPP